MSAPGVYRIEVCKGHCGRMTRNSHHRIEDHPGTVSRHKDGKCQFCYNNPEPDRKPAIPHDQQKPGLAPCKGSCGRITRPTTMLIEDYPGTVSRVKNGRCHWCHTHGDQAGPPPQRAERGKPKRYRKRREVTEQRVAEASVQVDAYTLARRERLARKQKAEANQQLLARRGSMTVRTA